MVFKQTSLISCQCKHNLVNQSLKMCVLKNLSEPPGGPLGNQRVPGIPIWATLLLSVKKVGQLFRCKPVSALWMWACANLQRYDWQTENIEKPYLFENEHILIENQQIIIFWVLELEKWRIIGKLFISLDKVKKISMGEYLKLIFVKNYWIELFFKKKDCYRIEAVNSIGYP